MPLLLVLLLLLLLLLVLVLPQRLPHCCHLLLTLVVWSTL
jgi:hypothetical protein